MYHLVLSGLSACRSEGGGAGDGSRQFLLPEAEVVIEEEPADAKKRDKTEHERMADYAALVRDKVESLPGELHRTRQVCLRGIGG